MPWLTEEPVPEVGAGGVVPLGASHGAEPLGAAKLLCRRVLPTVLTLQEVGLLLELWKTRHGCRGAPVLLPTGLTLITPRGHPQGTAQPKSRALQLTSRSQNHKDVSLRDDPVFGLRTDCFHFR